MKTTLLILTLCLTVIVFPTIARGLASDPSRTVASTMHDKNQTTDTVLETFHVAGDKLDPSGTGMRGVAPGYRFTQSAVGHPVCHYSFGPGNMMLVTLDVYALPEQPMYLHLICPHCYLRGMTNAIRITADQKGMSYDPKAFAPNFPGLSDAKMAQLCPQGTGGLLSVEPFQCTWEWDGQQRVDKNSVLAQTTLCDFHVAIDKNVLRRIT